MQDGWRRALGQGGSCWDGFCFSPCGILDKHVQVQGRYGVNLWGEFTERTVDLMPQLPPHTCCMQIRRTWAAQSLPWP